MTSETRCLVCQLPLREDGTHNHDPYGNLGLGVAARAAATTVRELSDILDRAFNGERCKAPGCGRRLNQDGTHRWQEAPR